jgi:hypothetical protein
VTKKNEAAPKLWMMAKTRIKSTTTNEQARKFVSLSCHNSGQSKTKSPGVVLLSVMLNPHRTTLGMITIWAILGNIGS